MNDPTWDEEKCIRLIREYKARPAVWDSTHEFYYKKPLKLELWKEIGHALNAPPTACRRKMLVLMSSLRREKARIKNSKLGRTICTGGKLYKSRWFAFEEMRFLVEKDKRRTHGPMDDDHQQEDDDGNEQENSSITLHENTNRIRIEDTLQGETRHQIPHLETNDLINIARSAPRRVTSNSEEEIRAFADFVAAKLMKYSSRTKNYVQHSICDIIFKADIKSYNEQDTSGMQEVEVDLMNESNVHGVKLEFEADESD